MKISRLRVSLLLVIILGVVFLLNEKNSKSASRQLRGLEAKIKLMEPTRELEKNTDHNPQTRSQKGPFNRAISLANQFILDNANLFSLQEHHQLAVKSILSPLGTIVSYQVYQDSFPILGMNIDLIVNRDGKVRIISNQYRPIERMIINDEKWLTIPEIFQAQTERFKLNLDDPHSDKNEVVIWTSPNSSQPELVYVVSVIDTHQKQKVPVQALFSVTTGQLVARHFPRSEFHQKPL